MVSSFLSLLAGHLALTSSRTITWKPHRKQKLKCFDFSVSLAETDSAFQPRALCRQSLLKLSCFQRLGAKEEGLWKPFCSDVTFTASAGSRLGSAVLGAWRGPGGGSGGRYANSECFPRPQQGLCTAADGVQKLGTFLWQQRDPEGLTSPVGSSGKGRRDLCCSVGL